MIYESNSIFFFFSIKVWNVEMLSHRYKNEGKILFSAHGKSIIY